MKKKFSTIVKGVLFTGLGLFILLPGMAQRDRGGIEVITQQQINQISEVVKPLKDQLDKQLNADNTGTYKAYLEDLKKLNTIEDSRERSGLTNKIMDKYSAFFKNIWAAAKVDEQSYQSKIRQALGSTLGKQIQFQSFLSFSVDILSAANALLAVSEPTAPGKCVDVCPIAIGEINGASYFIAAGGGAYGNCYLRTNAWGVSTGVSELSGFLRNGMTIPGTFPSDNRKLRVKTRFDLRQEATSFAGIGMGYASTYVMTFKTTEYIGVLSPLIFGCTRLVTKTLTEDYLMDKNQLQYCEFKNHSMTIVQITSAAWSYSDCANIKWSICEEN